VSQKPLPSRERPNVAAQVQERYTTGARRIATQSVTGLARTRVTPNALTVAGVTLCIVGSVCVWFEYRNELLFFWLGAALFLVGSILDILDGALARAGGKTTPFGGFLDSTTDRVGEGFMLGAIALVFARDGLDWAIALAFASLAGSFLVSYTRAKAEIMGLKGEIGIGGRAERVVVLVGGLVFAPWGGLPWAIVFLTALTWLTVVQRIWGVRTQMLRR
jgi:CDP-diacylglycerol--glycerol-3-phosphate 3-phosphatidyltransferase